MEEKGGDGSEGEEDVVVDLSLLKESPSELTSESSREPHIMYLSLSPLLSTI